MPSRKTGPRVLILDVECWPMLVDAWAIFDQTIGINQIIRDRTLLSFAAKWWNEKEVFYFDVRKQKNLHCDKSMMKPLRELIEQADILVGHNLNRFDRKVINASFATNNEKPLRKYRVLDTMVIAKRHFSFPSYSLEYLTSRLCPEAKKQKSRHFIGHDLWRECDRGNPRAWEEMEKYNKQDVRATEALWEKLEPFDNSINFNVYTEEPASRDCKCGGTFARNGSAIVGASVFQRYRCGRCGAEAKGSRKNILQKI